MTTGRGANEEIAIFALMLQAGTGRFKPPRRTKLRQLHAWSLKKVVRRRSFLADIGLDMSSFSPSLVFRRESADSALRLIIAKVPPLSHHSHRLRNMPCSDSGSSGHLSLSRVHDVVVTDVQRTQDKGHRTQKEPRHITSCFSL